MSREGAVPLAAIFTKFSDARKWVSVTAAASVEGRYCKTAEVKRHTLTELIDCYLADVLPQLVYSAIADNCSSPSLSDHT